MYYLSFAKHFGQVVYPILFAALIVGCTSESDDNEMLIACPTCNRQISKAALSCPNCGQPNPLKEKEHQEFRSVVDKDPVVGKDVLLASECLLQNNDVISLTFRETDQLTDDGLKHITKLDRLESLTLHAPAVTDDGLKNLIKLKELRTLDITGSSISPVGLESLVNFPKLEYLALDGGQATETGLIKIGSIPKLDRLALSGEEITDAALNRVTTLKNLRYLYLGNTNVTESGLARIKKARPDLTIVEKDTYKPL